MATRIGCDNFVFAVMSTEDTVSTAPTYGAVTNAVGVIAININPNPSQETLFADDGPFEVATTLGKIEVEVNKAYLTSQEKATLLGHKVDSKGGVIYGAADIPPYVAIGFRTLKSNGKYRYVWLYKGKFLDPEDNNETKGDGINFQTDTIKGNFVKLSYGYNIGSGASAQTVYPWKYEMDAESSSADATTISGWFNNVTMPTAGSTD